MSDAEWLACDDPKRLLLSLTDTASDRKVRLFGVVCCRRNADLFWYEESWEAVALAERYADGNVSEEERVGTYAAMETLPARRMDHDQPWADVAALRCLAEDAQSCDWPSPVWRVFLSCQRAVNNRPEWLRSEREAQCGLIRDIFGKPSDRVALDPAWLSDTAISLAGGMYDSRNFSAMPVLGDALEEAGCDRVGVLEHCRGPGPHVRGCWVVDLVLGREVGK